MKKVLKELLLLGVFIFILTNIISYLRKPELANDRLPQSTLTLLDGTRYRFEPTRPVIIHFWATWCRVCNMEASNIDQLSKQYDVITIAVNSGEDSAIRDYMKKYDLHFKVYNDSNGEWAKHFNVKVFPTTFIYDAKGRLRFTEVGYTSTVGLLGRMKLIE